MITSSQFLHSVLVILIGVAMFGGLVSAWVVFMDGLGKTDTTKRTVCAFLCFGLAFVPYAGLASIAIAVWFFKSEKIPKLPNITKGDLK